MSKVLELNKELDDLRANFESEFEKIREDYFKDKSGLQVIKSRSKNYLIAFSISVDLIKD